MFNAQNKKPPMEIGGTTKNTSLE